MEAQRSGHPPNGPGVKNVRSRAKDGTPERLRCETIQKEASQNPAVDGRRRCKKNFSYVLSCIQEKNK